MSEPLIQESSGILKVLKLEKDAKVPIKKYQTDAGLDVFAYENKVISPGNREVIRTGIAIQCPIGYYTRIGPRSGFALNYGIDTLAGICDHQFQGEIKVILVNHGSEDFVVNSGDRIAQLVVTKILLAKVEVVESFEKSERGILGFGSSGK